MHSQKKQFLFDDNISLRNIYYTFQLNKKLIISFLILGAIFGGVLNKISKPSFQGVAIVRPAKVSGKFLIDTKSLFTLINVDSFYSNKTKLACGSESKKTGGYSLIDFVKSSIAKNGDFIQLTFKSSSEENVLNCLDNVAEDIYQSQKKDFDANVNNLNTKLEALRNNLAQNLIEQKKIDEIHLESNNTKASMNKILANFIQNKKIERLNNKIADIDTSLINTETSNTKLLLPIKIFKTPPMSLKKSLAIGLLLGLILGFIIALIKNRSNPKF
jgi:hypothetical protein